MTLNYWYNKELLYNQHNDWVKKFNFFYWILFKSFMFLREQKTNCFCKRMTYTEVKFDICPNTFRPVTAALTRKGISLWVCQRTDSKQSLWFLYDMYYQTIQWNWNQSWAPMVVWQHQTRKVRHSFFQKKSVSLMCTFFEMVFPRAAVKRCCLSSYSASQSEDLIWHQLTTWWFGSCASLKYVTHSSGCGQCVVVP